MRAAAARPLPRSRGRDLAVRAWRVFRRDADRDADREWVRAVLRPSEYAIWIRQTAYDRRHSVRVARRVEQRLAGTPYAGEARWLAAALMHDVGKAVAGLSPISRAAAAFVNRIVDLETARRWARSSAGRLRRIGLYLIHGEVGARLIRDAGGREEIAAWTEAHQGEGVERVPGFPPAVVAALTGSDVA